jgi:uncharacterized membrane protein
VVALVVLGSGLALTALLALVALVVSALVLAGTVGLLALAGLYLVRNVRPALLGAGPARHAPQAERIQDSPVDVLRHRYAAGEIGQTEFRRQLVDLLKERYVRGDLTLAEFEVRVRHVLRDPALQSPAA